MLQKGKPQEKMRSRGTLVVSDVKLREREKESVRGKVKYQVSVICLRGMDSVSVLSEGAK